MPFLAMGLYAWRNNTRSSRDVSSTESRMKISGRGGSMIRASRLAQNFLGLLSIWEEFARTRTSEAVSCFQAHVIWVGRQYRSEDLRIPRIDAFDRCVPSFQVTGTVRQRKCPPRYARPLLSPNAFYAAQSTLSPQMPPPRSSRNSRQAGWACPPDGVRLAS